MKVSVSLPEQEVDYLDEYAAAHGLASRSAALQEAVRRLRAAELGGAYAGAWAEWLESADAEAWDRTAPDGLAG
ncbi:MAG: ribbon-helix-helix domain-containing protein [Candidatus Limnocylindrales bacterium]